jgi:predicted nucleotidyltransferase component of viral defense system
VEVEFLASADVKLKKNHPKLVEGFRVLQFPACAAAFGHPESIDVEGVMISGASNTVRLRVASLPDFIIMKAHAVRGRDKPKDVYDLCYCLDEYPEAMTLVAADWRGRRDDPLVAAAIEILREKFQTVEHYGPQQLAVFHDAVDVEERARHARRAFELVQKLLNLL